MALESKLQTRIIRHLKRKGWYVTKHILTSTNGWPDLEAIKNGRTVRIETKAKGKKLRPLQEFVHAQLILHGAEVYTADSWEKFLELPIVD